MSSINLITPPDKVFNLTPGIFLIKPNVNLKLQFQNILSNVDEDINVFIFDKDDFDVIWLLDVLNQADLIVVDIDNCDDLTSKFVSYILTHTNVFYLTNDNITPWHLLNRNRIYNLDCIKDKFKNGYDDEDGTT